MLNILKNHKEKIQMVLGAVLLYGLWHFGYEEYLAKNLGETGLDWNFNRGLAWQTAAWFAMFGYDANVTSFQIYPHLMYLNGEAIISIDTPCNGIPMLYLFGSFVLVYPGPWKRKLVFIPAGMMVIHGLNLIRIIALSYISIYSSDYFYFNHKYLFQIIVYGLILSLWFYWILYGQDLKTGWVQGLKDFIRLRFFSRLSQII
jgi:exosortase family protein XrtF